MYCDDEIKRCCTQWEECKTKWPLRFQKERTICCPGCEKYVSYDCQELRETIGWGVKQISQLLYQKIKNPQDIKIIILIGAGASVSSGILPSQDIKNAFIEEFKGKRVEGVLKKTIQDIKSEIDRDFAHIPEVREKIVKVLSEVVKIEDLFEEKITLEIILAIASRIIRRDSVVTKLSKEFPDRQAQKMPSIGYEILAHLAKHGFIDAIISMNFDEILERSLDDEIGEDGIFQIVSDEDFERTDYLEKKGLLEGKFKVFKPHGTVSAKHLMKFDIKNVVELSPIKYLSLKQMLVDDNTHIIFIGYKNNDIDMRRLLGEVARTKGTHTNNNIYWIIRASKTTNPYISGIYDVLRESESLDNHIVYPSTNPVFDTFLTDIAEEINTTIKEKDGIDNLLLLTRHKIRRLCFGNKMLEETFANKFKLEVLLYALKAKGAFYKGSLLDCQRISNYSTKLAKEKINAKSLLGQLENDILREIRGNLLIIGPVNLDELLEKTERLFGSHFILNSNEREEFKKLILELLRSFNIDITSKSRIIKFLFRSGRPIKNLLDLVNETKIIIDEEGKKENGEIRIITEVGEWLMQNDTKQLVNNFKNKEEFKVLVSDKKDKTASLFDNTIAADVDNELMKINVDNIRYIPSEEHYAHMTIGSNSAIYFMRKERSTNIAPVLVNDASDVSELKCRFNTLWEAALGNELRSFWLPFIREGAIIAIGTREIDFNGSYKESDRLRKRWLIGTKDFNAAYSIVTFLSRWTSEYIERRVLTPFEEISIESNQNYIMIGGPDVNRLTGKVWGLLKTKTGDWNNIEPLKRGFVFLEDAEKMKKEKARNIFYEKSGDPGAIGIVDYETSPPKLYRYNFKSNDLGIIIKAPNPLNKEKTVLLVMGFSGPGTENSVYFLINNNVQGEIANLNKVYNKNKAVEALLKIDMQNDDHPRKGKVILERPVVQIENEGKG